MRHGPLDAYYIFIVVCHQVVQHIYLYLFVRQILQISNETKAEKRYRSKEIKLFLQKFTILAHQIMFPRKELTKWSYSICLLSVFCTVYAKEIDVFQ